MQPGEYKYQSEWVVTHMEQCKKEGMLEARRELARKLTAEGFPVEKTAQLADLEDAEVRLLAEWVLHHSEKWKREGSLKARREFARKLVAEGFPVEKIAQMVELDEAEVRLLAD